MLLFAEKQGKKIILYGSANDWVAARRREYLFDIEVNQLFYNKNVGSCLSVM